MPRPQYPPAVDLEGKGSGPDSATPRASITSRPSDACEEDKNDGDGGDGNNGGNNKKKKKKGKKKQNRLGLVDTKRTDHRDRDHKGYEGGRRDDRRSPPRGHASGQWTSGHSGAHEDDRGRQGYGGHGDQRGPPAGYRPRPPRYGSEPRGYGYGGSVTPYFNQSRGPVFHTSPPRDERRYGNQSPRF
ncbi:unnamed protein product [Phytophthora fragariaefolia]|uniref:Unnamed protein product n=1 Tax=Phytophthora fragariaefolia TaxID=1490495 RepID=A0A9W6XEF3_9STRA|nr:unnamed protein product [Phytophthora fragariaefolia]